MATEVGKLYYDLNIDDSKLKSTLDKDEKAVKGFSDKVGAYWQGSVDASKKFALAVGVASAAVVGFGITSVKAYEDSQNQQAQLAAALASTHGVAGLFIEDLNDQAKALQRVSRFSDEQINASQALLLTFTQVRGEVFQRATPAILDLSQALHEDLQSATIQVGKALNDPILGVTALRRVGIQMTAAETEMIKKFMEANNIAGAQGVILGELNTQFGNSAIAAGQTFAGKLDILKNAFNDLQETVGKTIITALTPLIDKFALAVKKIQDAGGILPVLKKGFEENKGVILAMAGAIAGALMPAMFAFIASLATTLFYLAPFMIVGGLLFYLWDKNKLLFFALAGAVVGFAIGMAVALLPTIWGAVVAFGAMAIAVIAATWPFVLIGAAIGGAAYLIVTHWTQVKAFLATIWNWVKDHWPLLATILFGPFGLAAAFIIQHWDAVKATFITLFQHISAILGTVGSALAAFGNGVIGVFSAIWGFVRPILEFWMNLNIIVFGSILIVVLTIMQAIKSVIVAVWGAIWPYIAGVLGFIKDLIVNAWNFYLNIISTVLGAIWSVITAVGGAIFGYLSGLISGVFNAGKSATGSLLGGIGAVATSIGGFLQATIVNPIVNVFRGAAGWLYDVGKSIVQGLINGIRDMASAVSNVAGNLAKTVIDKVRHLLDAHSPSRVFHDIGKSVTQGFAQGINDTADVAMKAMSNLSASVVSPAINVAGDMKGGGNSATFGDTHIGQIVIQNQQDADYLLAKLNRNAYLQSIGVSPA